LDRAILPLLRRPVNVDQPAAAAAGAAPQLAGRAGRGRALRRRLPSLSLLLPADAALAAQAVLAVGGIDTEDFDLDLVAHLDHVLRAVHLVVGQFGDVQ